MHFFGNLGLVGTLLGGGILGYLAVLKLLGNDVMQVHGPLMVAGALLLMRTYFESQGRRIYAVREIRCRRDARAAR